MSRGSSDASSASRRFVLCRPHGGLNDTLGVIDEAWRLADDTGRVLVVDGRSSAFARDLSQWFEPVDPESTVVLRPGVRLRRILDSGTCHPESMQGRLESAEIVEEGHPTISRLEWRMPTDLRTGTPLRLDLDLARDLDHDVLLHECYGGGMASLDALRRLRLTRRAARRVRRRLRALPGHDRVGLQIRHTDLVTDHRSFLDGLADELAGRDVLVCSDDGAVLREARTRLPRSNVITTSAPPDADGRPYQVATGMSRRRRDRLALDTLVDLFALASCNEVRVAEVVNRTDPATGFGRLAVALVDHPELVDQLLGR